MGERERVREEKRERERNAREESLLAQLNATNNGQRPEYRRLYFIAMLETGFTIRGVVADDKKKQALLIHLTPALVQSVNTRLVDVTLSYMTLKTCCFQGRLAQSGCMGGPVG